MGIKIVKSGPAKGKINAIDKRQNVGVQEDGFIKQLLFRSKKRPRAATPSSTAGTNNGSSLGSQVQ